jgi:hypothetical protein
MRITSLAGLVFAAPRVDRCVCLPGQSCWPSDADWSSFNGSVGGKLTAIYPVGRPCHDPTFDTSVCSAITEQFTNGTWKSDQIGLLPTP